ncbi:MAG: fumarylacetoacetate hydrolase family protein [Deltaproteobacteria bacterium]|nr:fumarylacetoacetate hydrolase family protein [Deltaproteobacteria bacterium]
MYLTRHQTPKGPRWALDGHFLPLAFELGLLLQLQREAIAAFLQTVATKEPAHGILLPPLEPTHEVWACGVTYLRSREAREAESTVKDVYARVYEAKRPELFWKSVGWRVAGHQMPIRVRDDSGWNVPEPELTLVVNSHGQIVGYCVGNDVSSRDIEGENPLYLPQAKVYEGSCALGPGIAIGAVEGLKDIAIQISLIRDGNPVFEGATRTSQIKRPLEELVEYLVMELDFPRGAFLMTGTGIVPPHDFSMLRGDTVRITIGELTLENHVAPHTGRAPRV